MVKINQYIWLIVMICNGCANLTRREPCYNKNTYKLIDTTRFYRVTEIQHPYIFNDKNLESTTKRGIRFYKNGKAIEFNDYPASKNAEGTYCVNDKKAEVKFYYKHVQGNFWSIRKLEFKNDTIISYILPSPQTKGYSIKYIKEK